MRSSRASWVFGISQPIKGHCVGTVHHGPSFSAGSIFPCRSVASPQSLHPALSLSIGVFSAASAIITCSEWRWKGPSDVYYSSRFQCTGSGRKLIRCLGMDDNRLLLDRYVGLTHSGINVACLNPFGMRQEKLSSSEMPRAPTISSGNTPHESASRCCVANQDLLMLGAATTRG